MHTWFACGIVAATDGALGTSYCSCRSSQEFASANPNSMYLLALLQLYNDNLKTDVTYNILEAWSTSVLNDC